MIIRLSSVVALLLASNLLVPAAAAPAAKTLMVKAPPVKLEAVASSLPIWFEPNRGQVGGRTEWTSRAPGAWLFLTSNEVVYALPPAGKFDPAKTRGVPSFKTTNVHMRILGGRRVKGVGEGAMESYSNYFVGKHEDEWFTGVPHFERVRYADVYPGIDLVYYATGRSVEYDFLVGAGADPSSIELAFDRAEGVRVDKDGDLIVSAGGKSFRQHRPRVFQGTQEIEASYRTTERGTVKVEVGAFNPLLSLRVDPVLDFATYLGGPGEDSMSRMAITPDSNLVLVGSTQSPAAPTLDPFQQPSIVSLAPIVLKMASDGRRVLFYTVLGSGGWSGGRALGVDSDGTIVVGGNTRSTSFPLKNAFQSELKAAWDNGYVTRLSSDGRSLIHSSYLGGSNLEAINSVALDASGNSYFVGQSSSTDFPTVNPIQARHGGGVDDALIAKVGKSGTLVFSTLIGGSGLDVYSDIRWRRDGALIIVGYSNGSDFPLKDPIQTERTARTGYPNIVLTVVDGATDSIRYSTFLGGTATTSASRVSLDSLGRILITGRVDERGFPLKNPLFAEFTEGQTNGFLMQLSPDGKIVQWSTLLPGTYATGLCLDERGGIYLGGSATSVFPLKDSLQPFRGGGILNSDNFVMRFATEAAAVVYATLIGGSGNEQGGDIACGNGGSIYFVGTTLSSDYPVKVAYQREKGGSFDGVFGRISDSSAPPLPSFTVSPSNLTFRHVQNEPGPTPTTILVQGLTQAIAVESTVLWLRVSPQSLAASGTIRVSIDPTSLRPGSLQGTIRLAPAAGVPATINVTVNVLAPAPLLSGVEPARVGIGSGDTEITLRGSGFTDQTVVQLDSNPWSLSPVRVVDSSTIRLMLPRPYFAGETNFSFTVKNPDSAVSKAVGLSVGRPAPAIATGGIVSAASFAGQVISPGEIVTIFGENFDTGMRVLFDRIPASPIYVTPNQISVTVPYGIAGARTTEVIVEASLERRSVPVQIAVWPARPALFTANSSGTGQGAILNQDGAVNSDSNPAARESVIVLYGTGGGTLTGNLLELPVKVFIDGIDCEVLYAGVAPGLTAGALQVNVRVPEAASVGGVVLRVGDRESQEGVTFALR